MAADANEVMKGKYIGIEHMETLSVNHPTPLFGGRMSTKEKKSITLLIILSFCHFTNEVNANEINIVLYSSITLQRDGAEC